MKVCPLSYIDAAVSKSFGHITDIFATGQKMTGMCMSEAMETKAGNADLLTEFWEPWAYAIWVVLHYIFSAEDKVVLLILIF